MDIIDGSDREIDVEKIMATVKEHLDRQRAQGPSETESHDMHPIEASGSPPGPTLIEPLSRYLTMLNRLHDPKPQGAIVADGSPLKERAKRWLRRILAPYHRAIFARQEAFNANLVELLNRLLPAVSQEIGTAQALNEHETRHNYAAGLLTLRLEELARRNVELDGQLVELLYLKDRLAEAWARIESLRVEYDQAISQSYTQIENQIQAGVEKEKIIANRFEALRRQLAGLDTLLEGLGKTDGDLRSAHLELYRQVDEIKRDNLLQTRRLDLILTELRQKAGLDTRSVQKIAAVQQHLMDHSYYLFEVKHRGSREEIKKRQTIYLPLLKTKMATLEKGSDGVPNPVLDIGCGRGELLELLREQEIPARGIDLNEEMVQYCRDRDLEVEQVGAIPYLQAREDDSLGAVIACQVIEHLSTEELIEFLKLCRQKVMKGGLVILETVNPVSVLVSATSFYVDLSHVRQIHPLTLQFLVEAVGFLSPEVRFLSPYPDELKLQLLGSATPETQVLNRNFEKLNELLFGYQEYALICEK